MLQEVSGDPYFVKVLDFGLAKFTEERDQRPAARVLGAIADEPRARRSGTGRCGAKYSMLSMESFAGTGLSRRCSIACQWRQK